MAVSARLAEKSTLALKRYCRTHGLTKTAALERGIALLARQQADGSARHPSYAAYLRLKPRMATATTPAAGGLRSSDAMRNSLRARYGT